MYSLAAFFYVKVRTIVQYWIYKRQTPDDLEFLHKIPTYKIFPVSSTFHAEFSNSELEASGDSSNGLLNFAISRFVKEEVVGDDPKEGGSRGTVVKSLGLFLPQAQT